MRVISWCAESDKYDDFPVWNVRQNSEFEATMEEDQRKRSRPVRQRNGSGEPSVEKSTYDVVDEVLERSQGQDGDKGYDRRHKCQRRYLRYELRPFGKEQIN